MFDDPNRNLGPSDPYLNRYSDMSEVRGYAPLIALFAIALIVGGLFLFAPSSDQTKVADQQPGDPVGPGAAMPGPKPAKAPQQ